MCFYWSTSSFVCCPAQTFNQTGKCYIIFLMPKRKWPLRVFDAATSLIIYWTDAPAETETEKINSELLELALYQLLFDPWLWPAAMRWFDSREEGGFVPAECGSSLRLLSFFCIHSVFICSCLLCSSNTSHADWSYTCRSTWDAFQTLTVWHNFALPVLKSLKKKVNVRKRKRRGNKQGGDAQFWCSWNCFCRKLVSWNVCCKMSIYLSIYRWSALVFFVLGCWWIDANIGNINASVGFRIGSILTGWLFHQRMDMSQLALHTLLLLLPRSAPLSRCHMTQLRREQRSRGTRRVLKMTDAVTDHGREKAERSLELFCSCKRKYFALLD